MFGLIYPFALLASGITANKMILREIPAILFVGLRMLPAGLVLLTYCTWRSPKFWHNVRPHILSLAIAVLFTTNLNSILKAYALKHMLSSKVALIGSLDPFITALYMFLFFGERLTRNKWLGMFIGFCGTIVLIIYHSTTQGTSELFSTLSLAELAAFGALLLSRIGWIRIQTILKTGDLSAMQVNGITMAIGGIIALFAAGSFGQIAAQHGLSTLTVGLLTYTILVGNMAGYTLYGNLLKRYSATFVSLSGFSIPFFVYLYGWFFLAEPLYISFFISAAITFIGLVIFYKDELEKSLQR